MRLAGKASPGGSSDEKGLLVVAVWLSLESEADILGRLQLASARLVAPFMSNGEKVLMAPAV